MRQSFRLSCLTSLFSALALATGAHAQSVLPSQMAVVPVEVPNVVQRSLALGHADPNRVLHIAVSLPFADPAGMEAFVDSVSDPKNPNYGQFLSPGEVGLRFGQSA